jgi:hypothetical protein
VQANVKSQGYGIFHVQNGIGMGYSASIVVFFLVSIISQMLDTVSS